MTPLPRQEPTLAWVLLRYLPAALWGRLLSGLGSPWQEATEPPEVTFSPSWPGPVGADLLLSRGDLRLPVLTTPSDGARLAQVALAARAPGILYVSADAAAPTRTLAAARDLLARTGEAPALSWMSWAELGAGVQSFLPQLRGGELLAAADLLRLLRRAGVLGFGGFSPAPPAGPPWRYEPHCRRRFQGTGAAPRRLWRYTPAPYFAAAGRQRQEIERPWRYRCLKEQTCPKT